MIRFIAGLIMKLRIASMSAAFPLLSLLSPGIAADATHWNHNGSVMLLLLDGEDLTIFYDKPKRGLDRIGVGHGTWLFKGTEQPGGFIEGYARTFRRGCSPAEYFVSGTRYDDDVVIELSGEAPVREQRGCDVVDYSGTGSNARLVFRFIGLAESDDPPAMNAITGETCGWYTILACGRDESAIAAIRDETGAFEGDIIDTSDERFPNFRAGFHCLAIGPLGRRDARDLASDWKGRGRPDAYAKNNCRGF